MSYTVLKKDTNYNKISEVMQKYRKNLKTIQDSCIMFSIVFAGDQSK